MSLKNKLIISVLVFACIVILNLNPVQALTQEEAGQYIAEFSINYYNDYGDQTTYSWNYAQRAAACRGEKTSGMAGAPTPYYFENYYAVDCVGWVSMAIYQSLKISYPGINDTGYTGYVVPTKYANNYKTDIMEDVTGQALKPGDILANSHHVMVYVGNIGGKDTIVHSVSKFHLNYNTFQEYSAMNSTSGSDTRGVYKKVYRIKESAANKVKKSDATTIFKGSGGVTNKWSDSSGGSSSSSEAYQNGRIVDTNDKLPLFKHILLTEKYNFNNIKWKRYGHGYEGQECDMQENLTLGLEYPRDESNTTLDSFIDFSLPYLQTWMIPLSMNAGSLTQGSESDALKNPKFTYSIIKDAMSDIIANRYDITTCVLTTKYRSYDVIKVTKKYKLTYDENGALKSKTLIEEKEDKIKEGVTEPEEDVNKKVDIEPTYYIKQALTFDTKLSNSFAYTKYSDEEVNNKIEGGVGYVGKNTEVGEAINEKGAETTSTSDDIFTVSYEKKVGNYVYVYRTWRDELEVEYSSPEIYEYEDVVNYNAQSGNKISSSGIQTDSNGTNQTVKYGSKEITYSANFASQTKTPDELGLKYEKVEGCSTTNYDACRVCCETTTPRFCTGLDAIPGRKVVARWIKDSFVEYGDWVYIEGWGYALVADCGGFTGVASDKYHLDCFVGQEGDIQDDGKGTYSALKRKCINWKSVYERTPGNMQDTTIYVIKAEDIPEELLEGNGDSSTSNTSTSNKTSLDSVEDFLFIGDSLTVGLNTYGNLDEAHVIGVGASQAKNWLNYLNGKSDSFVSKNFKNVSLPSANEVNGVCVALGINSLCIYSSWSTDNVVENAMNAMKGVLEKLEEKYPGKPIYAQRVFPIEPKIYYDVPRTNQLVNEYNEALMAYCQEKGYNYIDATNEYIDENGLLAESKSVDGIHFKEYKTWSNNIRDAILNGTSSVTSSGSANFSSTDHDYYKILELDGEINRVDIINSKPSNYLEYLKKGTEYSEHVGYSRAQLTFGYSTLRRLFDDYFGDKKVVPYAYGGTLGFSTYTGKSEIKSGTYNMYDNSASLGPNVISGNIDTIPGAVQVPAGLGKVHTWTIWNHVNEQYNPESTWPKGSNQANLILHLTNNNERSLHGELSGNITANSKRMVCYGEWLASAMVAELGGTQGNPAKKLNVGDFIFIIQDNGTFYPVILTDTKVQFKVTKWDPNPANEWGHQKGTCMVEFQGHTSSWRDVPNTPEVFDHYISQVYVVGNVYTTPEYLNDIEKAAKDVGLNPENMINPKTM